MLTHGNVIASRTSHVQVKMYAHVPQAKLARFAAVFFLWLASIGMVVAASLALASVVLCLHC